MKKSESKEMISKKELIKRAGEHGFFKNKGRKVMYARSNGHFYYIKPPAIADGHETYTIKSEDVSGSGSNEIEYPLNMKDTVALIKGLEDISGVEGLIESGKLLKDDARQGVQKELAKLAKKED